MNEDITHLRRLSRIHQGAVSSLFRLYDGIGLLRIAVPTLVGITGACENVSTLFSIEGSKRLHLTQTGQLALEQALQFAHGVYCETQSFRTDRVDERHLNEFTLIEEEVCCSHPSIGLTVGSYPVDAFFDLLLTHITHAIRALVAGALDEGGEVLDELSADRKRLETALVAPFARVTYSEAIHLLNSRGAVSPITWGQDLKSAHELLLLKIIEERNGTGQIPVFVTHFPKEIKFFNMKVNEDDPRTVYSADLLLPGVGEAVGSALREDDHVKLVDRLLTSVMFAHIRELGLATLDDFAPYLNVVDKGRTAPHAGYGIGLERVIQYIIGCTDIRRSSVTYILNRLMGFGREVDELQRGSESPGF